MSEINPLPASTKALAIVPAGGGFQVSIPAEAIRLKQTALAKAEPIKQVTNADEQTAAIQATAVIKGLIAETEKTRAAVKQPYWDAGKAIDAKAKEFVKELEARAAALEGMISGFQRAEAKRIADEQAEAARKQRETEAAAQAERDRLAKIEADRVAAEAAAAAAKGKKAKAAADAELERLRLEKQEAELAAMEAEDDAAAANVTVVSVAAPAATGAAVSFVTDFEVTDVDAFYAWDLERRKRVDELLTAQRLAEGDTRPVFPSASFVKCEIKRQDFKGFISNLSDAELDSIPGVNIVKNAKAAVRGIAPSLALQ